MVKVVDTFLFFQELDLLELRLKYLDDVVDNFIIVEAAQTFSGILKPFIFEKNSSRYKNFLHKITYIKIEDTHFDYDSIISYLSSQEDNVSVMIKSLLSCHKHYDKKHLAWVLDSYHRECIHYGLNAVADDGDLILLSDLDELPSRDVVSTLHKSRPQMFLDLRQKEFYYFLNFFKNDNWKGTIAGPRRNFHGKSLNELRVDSKSRRTMFQRPPINEGGYHFTSVGDLEAIKSKIKSWAHQEYNNNFTMSQLAKNIKSGQDIFNRESGTKLTRVDVETSPLYDEKIRKLILLYPSLISDLPIESVPYSINRDFIRVIKKYFHRIIYEFKKAFILK